MANGVKIFIIIILLLIVAIAAFVGYKGITDPAPAVCDPECKWYQECAKNTDGSAVCNLKSYEGFEVKENTSTNDGIATNVNHVVVNPHGNFDEQCVQACRDNDACNHVVVNTHDNECWIKEQEEAADEVSITDSRTRVTFLKI